MIKNISRKGFTLTELLAILIILAITSIIAIPVVISSLNNSKNNVYDNQVRAIEKATENYFLDISADIEEPAVIYLSDILNSGYMSDNKIYNPKNAEKMTGCVLITLYSNQYHYKYIDNMSECSKYNNLNE